jgi:hypothetical protein
MSVEYILNRYAKTVFRLEAKGIYSLVDLVMLGRKSEKALLAILYQCHDMEVLVLQANIPSSLLLTLAKNNIEGLQCLIRSSARVKALMQEGSVNPEDLCQLAKDQPDGLWNMLHGSGGQWKSLVKQGVRIYRTVQAKQQEQQAEIPGEAMDNALLLAQKDKTLQVSAKA